FTIVGNGKLALEHVQENPCHLIIMDWHMPEMDGLTATGEIRSFHGQVNKVWIVGLTAGGADDMRGKCLNAGMDDHLAKPFEIDDFKNMLQQGINMAVQLQKEHNG
ncbi:MAG: response regulator, partial [Planctomycetes bacterium]|nr:response regulator [Planctomycetota bacterium]